MLLTTEAKLLLVLLVFSSATRAMDELEENYFKKVHRQFKEKIFLDVLSGANTIQEASKNWHELESVDREFNCILNDPIVIKDIVKTLHKKFKLRKLFVRYVLHTKETQQKLKERMKVIGQYAFLHHNEIIYLRSTLIREEGSTSFILERTCDILHEKRKDNPTFWTNTQDITNDYHKITLPTCITVNLNGYSAAYDGKSVAQNLLYLAENISGNRAFSVQCGSIIDAPEILENQNLKKMLDENCKFMGEKTLFKMVVTQVSDDFYPEAGGSSILHDEIQKRLVYVGE